MLPNHAFQVEKHKILQVNIDKTTALANGGHEAIDAGTKHVQLANTNHAAAVDVKTIENQNNVLRQYDANPTTALPNMNSNKVATDNSKLLNMGNRKKPSRGSSSFFDR